MKVVEQEQEKKKETNESFQLHKNTCRYLRWKENNTKQYMNKFLE